MARYLVEHREKLPLPFVSLAICKEAFLGREVS
jgi:hypothetical protein